MAKQNRKQTAAQRIESIRSKLDSGEIRTRLQDFFTEYFLCEMACKEMLVGYKESIGKPIKYKDAEMDLRQLNPAFDHFGIGINKDVRNRLFSSYPKSAKKIRNELVHGMSKTNLDHLNKQYPQMKKDMTLFLNMVLERL